MTVLSGGGQELAAGDGTATSLPVDGMTCRSCEARVEKSLRRLPGVADVHASSVRGRVDLVWDGAPDTEAAREAVAACGYRVGRPHWFSRVPSVWRTFAIAVGVVAAVAVLAEALGWSRLSSGVGDIAAGGLAVVLLLGLAAGFSSCMALTGGLILALSAAHSARMRQRHPDAHPGTLTRLRPTVVFVGGRVVGFAALGAVLGVIGSAVILPTSVVALLMLGVGVLMAVLGVRLTEVSPRIAGWSLTLPGSVGRRMDLEDRAEHRYSDVRTATLGAATFFLPCGFTQATQLFALSTGSAAYAALIMGTFALGTAPGLLAFGGLPELVPARHRTTILRGLGVLVMLFAALNISSGLRLMGVDLLRPFGQYADDAAQGPTSNVTVGADVQTLTMQQVTDGYVPSRSTLYAGIPIRWVIDGYDPQSCTAFLRSPSVGVSVTLSKGRNVIELPAQEPGRIMFACSMGMTGGTITVVPRPAA